MQHKKGTLLRSELIYRHEPESALTFSDCTDQDWQVRCKSATTVAISVPLGACHASSALPPMLPRQHHCQCPAHPSTDDAMDKGCSTWVQRAET